MRNTLAYWPNSQVVKKMNCCEYIPSLLAIFADFPFLLNFDSIFENKNKKRVDDSDTNA
jgi:hypothetical protein